MSILRESFGFAAPGYAIAATFASRGAAAPHEAASWPGKAALCLII
jgi:hypothetical protein